MSTIQAFFQSCRMFANQSFQKVIREIVKILGTKELERQTKSVEPNVLILNGCSESKFCLFFKYIMLGSVDLVGI